MNFAFSAEQEMLRETVRGFLDDKVPMSRVRELMETDDGFDPGLWQEMAAMGWQGMAIPEDYGGAGFSYLELGILLEEMGRSLTPAPFFSTVVLGAGALLLAGSEEQRKESLPAIAVGERKVALAVVEPDTGWDSAGITLSAAEEDGEIVLDGVKSFVIDGHIADAIIVAARSEAGIDLFLVGSDASGVSADRLETMDMTRKQALVRFEEVRVPVTARVGETGTGWDTLRRLYDLAAVALAFEQVGGAQQCLDMAVDYAKVRHQFGRPIGSFQAVKHKCADMLVQVESAKSAAYYAGWAASADDAELRIVAPLAKSYCSDAYFFCAAENIQVHGGIGFTWEHDAHLYFKRAKSSQLLFGDPSEWREKLADRLGL